MTIRDRGKLKWRAASFVPLVFYMKSQMYRDQERMAKPLIDEYEAVEFDQRICYAMEHKFAVKLSVWADGFISEITGPVHYVDPITLQLHVLVEPREIERVAFKNVVGVMVID